MACAAADVTWERVQSLVSQPQPESLTLEYKSAYTPGLVKTVAAMANSYGGLIVVGGRRRQTNPESGGGPDRRRPGRDHHADRQRLRQHPRTTVQPEIIEVPVPAAHDRFVLVVRVDPMRAPRPLLIDGKAPIRLHGSNATADRHRLAQLFAQGGSPFNRARLALPRPQLPRANDGAPTVDYILRSGMQIPVDDDTGWRPLSERGVDALAAALNTSPLQQALLRWCDDLHIHDLNPFRRRGHNRARHVRLVWQALAGERVPIEVIAEAVLPPTPGTPNSHLRFTLDILPAIQQPLVAHAAQHLPPELQPPGAVLRLGGLHRLLDAMLATLTSHDVVATLAALAGIDPVAVSQPASLDLQSGPAVTELLDMRGLTAVTDAGASHGANLVAQPALDLRNPVERHRQVDDWLVELALDAGYTGMGNLLDLYHQMETKQITGQ